MSYHNRNVPVFSTIEMSPGFGFMLLRKRVRVPLVKSLFFKDDSKQEEGSGVGSGKGARGKGQQGPGGEGGGGGGGRGPPPFSPPALEKPSTRGSPHADCDSEWQLLRLHFPAPTRGSWPAPSAGFAVPVAAAGCCSAPPSPH